MKVTYNWLKDFVDIDLPAGELAEKLTMAGLEVESLEKRGDDFVFTIEVTSNRPDWLSVAGIAREVAAVTGKKLKIPAVSKSAGKPPGGFSLRIENTKDCSLYIARIVSGVSVAAAPDWMRQRLELVGVRSVNNIVDITNYVLFELGEPLHAFDLDTLAGSAVVVRRARKGEKLVTIDGKEQTLDPDILVIADAEKPVAVAGVMGGKDTEVGGGTKNILLEAAVFDPVLVRRGRQKLGMQSEASYRFERGVSAETAGLGSLRAQELFVELGKGTVQAAAREGAPEEKERTVELRRDAVKSTLGIDVGISRAEEILGSLGFVSAQSATGLSVRVPHFRRDVRAEIDLIEEIARIYGFDKIPSALPALVPQPIVEYNPAEVVKNCLQGQGFDEVITYSLLDRSLLRYTKGIQDPVTVTNPLSCEQELLRPVLLPSLARCVSYNLKQRQAAVAVFETAKTYHVPDIEKNVLGIAASGTFVRWLGPRTGNVRYEAGFLLLKGCVEALCAALHIDGEKWFVEKSGFEVEVTVRGKPVGTLRQLHREELDLFEIKEREVFVAEIDLDVLLPMAAPERKFKAFPRFPSVTRDVTFELKEEVTFDQLAAAIAKSKTALLAETAFLDYYDKNLPEGTKRITVSFKYASGDKTLTDEEVNKAHSAMVDRLTRQFPARTV